jgi:hypothetical protein
MLADDIAATAGSRDDVLYSGAFTEVARRVRDAARFDLAPDVMRSAFTIAHSPVGGQLRALPLCKLPFRSTWFEWPGGFAGVPSERTDMLAPVPKRLGALVHTDESLQRGTIIYAWNHVGLRGGVNICPLGITFDWRAEPEPLADLTGAAEWLRTADEERWRAFKEKYSRIRNSSREDVLADNLRFGVIINPAMKVFMDTASYNPAFDKLLNAAIKDIEGEAPLLRAAIMLLNSRNLAEHRPRPISPKLNKARTRNSKAPLLGYTHVEIRLTRALGERAGMAADARHPARLHLVRGHFKIRSSGVYWWSPHARGAADSRPIERQQRSVKL